MHRQLTVVNVATGARADLLVDAGDAEPAGPLLVALRAAVGAAGTAGLTIDDHRLPADGDVASCRIRAGATVVVGASDNRPNDTGPHDTGPNDTGPTVDLVVRAGPDAGRRFGLAAGEYVVGRDPDCAVTIGDPAISRRHLAVLVDATGGVIVTDLGSANGTITDDVPPATDHPALPITVLAGDSVITIDRHRQRQVGALADPVIEARPQLAPAPPVIAIDLPALPTPVSPPRIAVLAAAVPLAGGVVLSLVLHQWQFLMFTALSPLMIVGQALADRRATTRQNRAAAREHLTATAQAHARLAAALSAEATRRCHAAPDPGVLGAPHAADDGEIWQRRATDADALRLRLGRADLPSEIAVTGGDPATVRDVPLVVSLADIGELGVSGPRSLVLGLSRGLLIQAAALHDPGSLQIIVLAPGRDADWGWVRWLPQLAPVSPTCTVSVGFDTEQVDARLAELAHRDRTTSQRLLAVVDADIDPRYDGLAEEATVIWCAGGGSVLPASCAGVVTLTDRSRPRLELAVMRQAVRVGVPDLMAADVAESIARQLAPLRTSHAAGANAVPPVVRWHDRDSSRTCLDGGWDGEPSTEITLGVGARGPVRLDLVRDGPHALVAGTTGSGKSELLISLVAGLASRNTPDQLVFLLIDHKGGAALGSCARLPHTVGVVTDLDPVSTRRALLSIGAELRRREDQLAGAGVSDITAYQQRCATGPRLPRLVIVIDEFAALTHDQPDFVGALVAIAQRGRSLGLHLVLATQRPEVAVSADIRANTRVRICLGVTREQDSREVIDSPAAAAISRATPGRAYLRIGPGELHLLQTAQVTGPTHRNASMTVTPLPATALGEPVTRGQAEPSAQTDLDDLVDAITERAASLGCGPPRRPWLPPLASHIELSGLTVGHGDSAWGLVDLPAEGRQSPLLVAGSAGVTTLIVGSSRSGRSTAAVTRVVAMATVRRPDALHIWAIDAAADLQPLAMLPHCGAVIAATDRDRVAALLDHLADEVARRRLDPGRRARSMLLVVDGWEALVDHAADRLLRLAVDGPSMDLHLVITGDRGLLTGRLASVAAERIVLRLADPTDYVMVGIACRDVPDDLPPGRGFRANDGALLQIAAADPLAVQRAARHHVIADPPRSFAPLPVRVTLAEIRRSALPVPVGIVVGLDADGLAPVVLDPVELGPVFAIYGPPRSGRSSALRLLADQLADEPTGRPVAVICRRRSPLASAPGTVQLPLEDPDHALAVLDALVDRCGRPPVILVDDLDHLDDGPLTARIESMMRRDPLDGAIVAVSATLDSAIAAFRGPLATARRHGHGVLLGPRSVRDGQAFGVSLRPASVGADPPGRGWLMTAGQVRRIQLAEPPADARQPSTEFELAAFGWRSRE